MAAEARGGGGGPALITATGVMGVLLLLLLMPTKQSTEHLCHVGTPTCMPALERFTGASVQNHIVLGHKRVANV